MSTLPTRFATASALTTLVWLGGCAAVEPLPNDVAELTRWMSGTFSSHAQSVERPGEFLDIRLVMVPIWRERDDGAWLYVEQAVATAAERPYRQRVYHLSQSADGSIVSEVFTLPGEALEFAGAWKRPEAFAKLSPGALTPRTGCAITLRRNGGRFEGSTNGTDCPSELGGAKYATSEAFVRSQSIETWDRGYAENGEQVWGSKAGPYRFMKVSERPPLE